MNATKFTPGPWEVGFTGVSGSDGILICEGRPSERSEANAHLIAAAPDLYEALAKAQEFLDYCGWGDSYEQECAKASGLPGLLTAALAKARGEA